MMHTTGAVTFGVVCGLLLASMVFILLLMRYVSNDLDGFRKWLDQGSAL